MSFEIYFDESNKLDKKSGENAYYGVIGWENSIRNSFDTFMIENKIFKELHFTEFNLDKVEKYLKAIEYILNKTEANFYIVNKEEAFKMGTKIGINERELRRLFYIKIPERLIYGMTRKMKELTPVDIYIDSSDEYGEPNEEMWCNKVFLEKLKKLCITGVENQNNLIKAHIDKQMNHIQLPKTLKSQLNAQALYRGLNYSVNTVDQIDSKSSKSLQIIDILLGVVKFLVEEEYLNPSEELSIDRMKDVFHNPILNEEEKEFIKSCYDYRIIKKTGEENYILNLLCEEKEKVKKIKEVSKIAKIYSQKSIQKAELIYRLLSKSENLNKFYNFNIFSWSEDEEERFSTASILHKAVVKEHISKYVAQFFQFKTEYDTMNKMKLQRLYISNSIANQDNILLSEKEYKDYLKFGTSLKLLVRRYLTELEIDTKIS